MSGLFCSLQSREKFIEAAATRGTGAGGLYRVADGDELPAQPGQLLGREVERGEPVPGGAQPLPDVVAAGLLRDGGAVITHATIMRGDATATTTGRRRPVPSRVAGHGEPIGRKP
jgi:hypothetical protein